jgi:hypothetical protein
MLDLSVAYPGIVWQIYLEARCPDLIGRYIGEPGLTGSCKFKHRSLFCGDDKL